MTTELDRAEKLFTELLESRCCISYSLAYARIFGDPPQKWTQRHSHLVIEAATHTEPRKLSNGWNIRLDALIVNSRTREPGPGHFRFALYTLAEWRDYFSDWNLLDSLF